MWAKLPRSHGALLNRQAEGEPLGMATALIMGI